MRRLDIGISVFGNAEQLHRTVVSLNDHSATDKRIYLIVNPHPDPKRNSEANAEADWLSISGAVAGTVIMPSNVGYAGAVRTLIELAQTEYVAYCDSDIEVITPGWDEALCSTLDKFHEIGLIFPNDGAYPIPRGNYSEVMWAPGFCWIVNRLALYDVGGMDTSLGHQEEADWALRIRMAGWKCAALPSVRVRHDATATNDPASIERINAGVRRFVDKWEAYFGGKRQNYHSPTVLRWELWPPNALHMEEWWKGQTAIYRELPPDAPSWARSGEIDLSRLNENAPVVNICGTDYDLIQVPRLSGFYRGRII